MSEVLLYVQGHRSLGGAVAQNPMVGLYMAPR
jgi:hypothetical protein